MSLDTQLPDVSAKSRALICGRSKVQGMVAYIIQEQGGGDGRKRGWAGKGVGGNTGGCVGVGLNLWSEHNKEWGNKWIHVG